MRREHEVEAEALDAGSRLWSSIELAEHAALRMPNGQARSELAWETEQVELGPEPAMIALLGFFELGQVCVERPGRRPGGAIDPLQLISLLVTPPVGPGAAEQLDRRDPSGGREVRSTTEVDEVEVSVDGDLLAGSDLARLDALDDLTS